MKITVTKEHIKKGVAYSPNHCPIAKAIRPFSNKKKVTVGPYIIHINNKSYEVPWIAKSFMMNFDLGSSVKPFKFELV